MNEKDAAAIKVLSELGLRSNPEIPQEFKNFHPDNADDKFLDDVKKLFINEDIN